MSTERRTRRPLQWRLGLAIALIAAATGRVATAGDRWEGLQGLSRVSVEVTLSPYHPGLAVDEVRRRVEEALRRSQAAPAVESGSPERLHLIAGVRAYSSSDLRGFYLPLSQTYGIGPVRLVVERPAQVIGLAAPVMAQVWQAERQAKGPWRTSAAEILELTDEVVTAFVADYRRATGK